MTRKLMIGTSYIAMTAVERAKGRYMRAPDGHGDGGDGGNGGGDGGNGGDGGEGGEGHEPEPIGEEINESALDEGSQGGRQPAEEEDDSGSDDGSESEEGDGKPKPKSSDEQIGELASRLEALERTNAEQERDLAYWMGRANGTIDEEGNPIGEQKPQDDGSIPPDDPDRPDPSKYQYGETDAAYIRDLARYEAKKAYEEERAGEEVKKRLQQVQTAHEERVGKAKERLADYDEKVVKGADPDPVTKQPKWACSQLMTLGIKTSDYGPDIAYHLASNPEESFRIAQLSPIEQAKEFGRLEYKMELEAQGRGEGSESSTRSSSAPPPPPRARGGSGRSQVPDDTDDFASFEQKVDSKKSKKRRFA